MKNKIVTFLLALLFACGLWLFVALLLGCLPAAAEDTPIPDLLTVEEALAQLPQPREAIEGYVAAKYKGRSLDFDERRKLGNALLRRGFDWHDIRPVLNALGEEIEE